MPDRGAYGKRLGDAFRDPRAPSLVTRVLQKSTLAVTVEPAKKVLPRWDLN